MDKGEGGSPTDLYRRYVEKAFRALAPYVSPQSGFLHVHPDVYDGLPVQAAPTYENFLYALLLLRRKTVESIQEGKALLERLLFFQNTDPSSDQYGNFPHLLTDYPTCRDWHLPALLCLPLAAIRTGFDTVLGAGLKERLHACHRLLLTAALENQKKVYTAPWEAVVLGVQKRLLDPLSDQQPLPEMTVEREWFRPEALGRALAAFSTLQNIPIPQFECALQMWHRGAATYDGPALGVFEYGEGPETTLFDCLMSVYSNIPIQERPWPYRASLELALITPPGEAYSQFQERQVWGSDQPVRIWPMGKVTVAACFFSPRVSERHGFHPVRIVTPSETVVFHFPNGSLVDMREEPTGFVGRVHIDEIRETDPCLIRMFVERHDKLKICIDGKRASAFDPKRGVSISAGSLTMHMAVNSSLCACFGHVSLGNRPGQMLAKRATGGEAYDWKISVDFIRGEVPCDLSFTVEIREEEAKV